MTITSATPTTSVIIETDEKDYNRYQRCAPDSWWVYMGESAEIIYDFQELESAYQAYKAALKTQSEHPELP